MSTASTTDMVPAPQVNGVAPKPPAAPLTPSYAQGFEGAASAPFPADALAVLGAPVNPEEVEIKSNGIVYLPGVAYRRILTRAFGAGAWALLPRGPARTMGEIVIYHGALYILGRFVSEAVGECETRFGMSYASSLEGARTDALTRCCKDLGVATELWDPEWRNAWQAAFCKKEWRDGKDGKKGSWHWEKVSKDQGEPSGRNVGAPKGPAAQDLEKAMKASLEQIQAQRQKDSADTDLGDATKVPAAPMRAATENGQPTRTPSGQGVNPGADGQAVDSPDLGLAPTPEEIQAVRDAIKALGWAAPKARSWAQKNFGVSGSAGMTKDQCASALALLQAAKLDDNDDAYCAIYDRLKAQGKVL